MTSIDSVLAFNREYVASKGYEKHLTDKYPDKKLAVVSCMDTRLSVLLQEALGLRNGDVTEIMVVAHTTCGACHMSFGHFREEMLHRGIPETALNRADVDLTAWLEGFHDTERSVRDTVATIVNHPLMPSDVTVRGFVIESATGELTEVE